jgi:hypothetical protein
MSDFSNLTYNQKKILLSEVKDSIYNHKHTKDEIEELKTKIKNQEKLPVDDYNSFDREVSEILLKQFRVPK